MYTLVHVDQFYAIFVFVNQGFWFIYFPRNPWLAKMILCKLYVRIWNTWK